MNFPWISFSISGCPLPSLVVLLAPMDYTCDSSCEACLQATGVIWLVSTERRKCLEFTSRPPIWALNPWLPLEECEGPAPLPQVGTTLRCNLHTRAPWQDFALLLPLHCPAPRLPGHCLHRPLAYESSSQALLLENWIYDSVLFKEQSWWWSHYW